MAHLPFKFLFPPSSIQLAATSGDVLFKRHRIIQHGIFI